MNSLSRFLLLLVMVGLYGIGLVSPARAQFSSAIEGTVSDQSGAPVPGATIVVTNQATNVRYQGVSTTSGSFRVPALPPGTYRIDVQAPGLQVWTQAEVVLEPNKIRTVARRITIRGWRGTKFGISACFHGRGALLATHVFWFSRSSSMPRIGHSRSRPGGFRFVIVVTKHLKKSRLLSVGSVAAIE
jgi:hypothetical protein